MARSAMLLRWRNGRISQSSRVMSPRAVPGRPSAAPSTRRWSSAARGLAQATSLSAMTMALWRSTPTPSEAASVMRKPSGASRGNGRRASPPAGRWLKPLDLQSRQQSESQPARSLKRSCFPTALANDKQQRMIQEPTSAVRSALRTIATERKGLDALEEAIRATSEGGLGAAFSEAIKTISAAPGRVIVTGIGKSGHIARKIAATLASTGEPAFFVHPAEASHGDLGMVQIGDVVLAISWSGETVELAAIVTFAKRYAIPLIAMTAEANSALGREADVCLMMPHATEACPNGLAPTTSTTMQLVLGDALAIALLEGRGFTALDFRALHPGGKLGAKLAHVREVMHTGERVPRIGSNARMAEAIVEMTSKGFGCVAVFEEGGRLAGIITDGDLRRHLKPDFSLDTPVGAIMTRRPRTIAPDALVAEALELISHKIQALLVVERGQVVGIVNFHDLMRIGAF